MAAGSGTHLCRLNKPDFSLKQAAALVEREFGLKVAEAKSLPSYDDQNFYVRVAPSEGNGEKAGEYVLKIINCEDSQNPGLIEVQTQIMMFLNKEGFPVPTPRFTKEGEIMFLESVETPSGPKAYMARLLTYLPGQTVAKVPVSPPLLYEIGQLAARLDKTLTEKFQHPLIKSLHRSGFIWNLANVPLLKQYIHALGDSSHLEVVKEIIEHFTVEIVPKLRCLRPCIHHGDLNDHNILVDADAASPDGPRYQVSGILDFSDMSYGYYVFEVAITIMYMMIESQAPLSVGGHILSGFESIIPLTAEERGLLFHLVCGRFAQSLVMAAHTSLLHPDNKEYLMITSKTGWKHLMTLVEKFRFCGDLDCPDWVLAEISTLAKISSVKLKLICAQVLKDLLGDRIDYEKVLKLTSDAKFESGDVKATIAVLSFILSSAAKHNVDSESLSSELQQLGLPKEHATGLCRSYEEKQMPLQDNLRRSSLRLSSLDSVSWRVDYTLSSSQLQQVNEPVVHLKLNVKDVDRGSLEPVAMSLSAEKFRVLLAELKQAQALLKTLD